MAAGLKVEQWREAVFIDGEFRQPSSKGTLDVRDKASGEIFATAGLAGADDVAKAVAATRRAQPAWAQASYAERAAVLRAAAALAATATATETATDGQVSQQYRELVMRETGCIGGKADYEALAPFAGLGQSGLGQSGLGGRSGGDANIEEFTERRWLTVNTEPAHYPY